MEATKFVLHTGDIMIDLPAYKRVKPGTNDQFRSMVELALYRETENKYNGEHAIADKASWKMTAKVFLTTPNVSHLRDALLALEKILQVENIDVIYISLKYSEEFIDVWKALEEYQANGKVRVIAVSDFSISDLKKLLAEAAVPPRVNQIKFLPNTTQLDQQTKDIVSFCKESKIGTSAHTDYSNLDKLDVTDILNKYKKEGKWNCDWVLQYTGNVRCRTLTASRGYLFGISPVPK
eukprot:TRINITY_DN1872_c0_g1_i1.p1 TRINITY_DN1872_c0_g1~~TRINITY_DN1872_c0_g1_i1.p1  ORF type:complete len:236 (-),score=41.73 TRINITY_DN1872_c0_g1_i1:39-746(-)